ESSSGSYCGIGVVVQQNVETGIVTAVRPYENCPGYEAGIRPGDIILAVNGTEITGMDLNAAVSMIRGEEGTKVTLTIRREEEEFDVEVTRRQIDVETVSYKMLQDNIGYILVEEFDEVTAKQFTAAMDALEEQGMEALVVDIRNNPGGLLNIVVDMLDEILPKGVIVSVKDKNGATEEYTSDADTRLNVPLAVLINGNSASASEIFAGAVQDYGVGTLVGTTTFGKGIVQTIFSMRDGTGVKVTIEDYYTPSGRSIHKIGVDPDVEIDLPDELKTLVTIPEDEDVQLQKAIEILKKQMR
ncbi:MAG: S41 family peptidase, partial [Lachnospiraceae bacterium]